MEFLPSQIGMKLSSIGQELPNCFHGTGAVPVCDRMAVDVGVFDDKITPRRNELTVSRELPGNMGLAVIGVQNNHYMLRVAAFLLQYGKNRGIHGGPAHVGNSCVLRLPRPRMEIHGNYL